MLSQDSVWPVLPILGRSMACGKYSGHAEQGRLDHGRCERDGTRDRQAICRTWRQGAPLDMNAAAAAQATHEIVASGGIARFYHADIAHEAQIAAKVDAAVEAFGQLDYAVNNAALPPDRSAIAEANWDEFDRIVSVNVRAVLGCMKYKIRAMLAGSGGAIVNVGR